MIVVLDANMLVYLFDEKANPPLSKATGQPVDRCKERLDHLVASLAKDKAKIIVPTPALAEVLVYAQQGAPERLNIIKTSKHFRVAPFDERAAVEFAAAQANGRGSTPRAKAKFVSDAVNSSGRVRFTLRTRSEYGRLNDLGGT